jgi:hypothetical protein
MLQEQLMSADGCVAGGSIRSLRRGVYRSHVNSFCSGGVAQARRLAAGLHARKPWYRVSVTPVPVVAFTMTSDVDGARSTGDPVDAALDHLPIGEFSFIDGDDTSLTFVGRGVSQAQLNAAHSAFARALGVPITKVEVGRLTW